MMAARVLVRAPNRSGGGCGLGTKKVLLGLAISQNLYASIADGLDKINNHATGSSRVAVAACKSQLIELTGLSGAA